MAASITTITNTSNQTVPILISAIARNKANDLSQVNYAVENQTQILPGAQLIIETQRVDLGQLNRLRDLKLIVFS